MSEGDPRAAPLREDDVDPDPFVQVAAWLAEARAAGIELPEAMTLATATPEGRPSARMVLLKEAGPDGFTFFSNHESRKGRELAANPHAALVLYWHVLGRQVRAEGEVERLGREQSETYFRSRPPGSRIAALASPQSSPVPNREALEALYEAAAAGGDEPPLPEWWGGYRLRPESIELWQHRENRLHDRLRYRLEDGAWRLERLAP